MYRFRRFLYTISKKQTVLYVSGSFRYYKLRQDILDTNENRSKLLLTFTAWQHGLSMQKGETMRGYQKKQPAARLLAGLEQGMRDEEIEYEIKARKKAKRNKRKKRHLNKRCKKLEERLEVSEKKCRKFRKSYKKAKKRIEMLERELECAKFRIGEYPYNKMRLSNSRSIIDVDDCREYDLDDWNGGR